ncbi:MAG: nuclear transport factor 2 family protein [Alphaproteobacteria bacterium]|nr:nuclear transport factor 2 family protein [Alphaproteobacteria bacterium]
MVDFTPGDLSELVARKNILDVLTRYCRALERCDVELMRSVYWDDGRDDHGVFSGDARAFAEFIIDGIQNWFEDAVHAVMNVHVEIFGDTAYTESYFYSLCTVAADRDKAAAVFGASYVRKWIDARGEPGPHRFFFGGRYVDRLERRMGEWKIAHRQVVMDWNMNSPASRILDEGMFATLRLRGVRGRADPVFANIP